MSKKNFLLLMDILLFFLLQLKISESLTSSSTTYSICIGEQGSLLYSQNYTLLMALHTPAGNSSGISYKLALGFISECIESTYCNCNSVCEKGETQENCPQDCKTKIEIEPQISLSGNEVNLSISFSDSRYVHTTGTRIKIQLNIPPFVSDWNPYYGCLSNETIFLESSQYHQTCDWNYNKNIILCGDYTGNVSIDYFPEENKVIINTKCILPSLPQGSYILNGTIIFNQVEKYYMRSDTHTINGLTGYKLKLIPSGISTHAQYAMSDDVPLSYNWKVNVYIRKSDSTTVPLGSVTFNRNGLQKASIEIPETNTNLEDAIEIDISSYINNTLQGVVYFITEPLGVSKINQTIWNVYLYTKGSYHLVKFIEDDEIIFKYITTAEFYWDGSYESGLEVFSSEEIKLLPAIENFIIATPFQLIDLRLTGSKKYLNIIWRVEYKSTWKEEIKIKCFLNCFATEDIEEKCINLQNCTSIAISSSPSICTILEPEYNFSDVNRIVCKLYSKTNIFSHYVIDFWPLNFSIDQIKNLSTTVGSSLIIPITIRNLGLLDDNYTINITPLNNQNFVSIKNNLINVSVKSNDISLGYLNLIPLYSTPIDFGIWVYSNSPEWFDCNNCPSNFICEVKSNKCAKYLELRIENGNSSLGEINLREVIFLILIVLVLIYRKGL